MKYTVRFATCRCIFGRDKQSVTGKCLLWLLGIHGGDFGAEDVEPAAMATGVDGFAVHEGMDRLVAAGGALLSVIEKNGGVGVDADGAKVRERVAFHDAGFDGVALLGEKFRFSGDAVSTEKDGIIGHGVCKAVGLFVFPGFPEFFFGGGERCREFVAGRGDGLRRCGVARSGSGRR